ncbi:MAG: hypothetical protein G3M78_13280 [Candidatus Nitrohelix vancouverensis]|uniref:Uncharacterized protein n=1 Tax=Candidatus Nitrohelix vancouverensis TaxID=2705534 RepID=A0A7T0C4C8_9BACT|nr:MAG: hypothetical protein G3M78_13280 [Candidatus Nitrohelix vancouverensis]
MPGSYSIKTEEMHASLQGLLLRLAESFPLAQAKLDNDFLSDLNHFLKLYPQLEAIMGEAASGLQPSRQLLTSTKLECGVQLSVDQEKVQKLRALPINSSHRIRYGSFQQSKITLEIKQVPVKNRSTRLKP